MENETQMCLSQKLPTPTHKERNVNLNWTDMPLLSQLSREKKLGGRLSWCVWGGGWSRKATLSWGPWYRSTENSGQSLGSWWQVPKQSSGRTGFSRTWVQQGGLRSQITLYFIENWSKGAGRLETQPHMVPETMALLLVQTYPCTELPHCTLEMHNPYVSVKSFKNINARNLDLEILQEMYLLNLLTHVRNTCVQRDPLQHQAEYEQVNEGGDHKGNLRLVHRSDKDCSQMRSSSTAQSSGWAELLA